jgi:hypothetical protein
VDIFDIAYIGYESPNNKAMLDAGPVIFGFGLMESRDDDTVYLTLDDNLYRIAVHQGQRDRFAYGGWALKDKWPWESGIEELHGAGVPVDAGGTWLLNGEFLDACLANGLASGSVQAALPGLFVTSTGAVRPFEPTRLGRRHESTYPLPRREGTSREDQS